MLGLLSEKQSKWKLNVKNLIDWILYEEIFWKEKWAKFKCSRHIQTFNNNFITNLVNEDGDPGAFESVVAIEDRLSVQGGNADELLIAKNNWLNGFDLMNVYEKTKLICLIGI